VGSFIQKLNSLNSPYCRAKIPSCAEIHCVFKIQAFEGYGNAMNLTEFMNEKNFSE